MSQQPKDAQKVNRVESPRLIWLESFTAVCSHQTYALAADALGLGDQTVRDNVTLLEGWLGHKLFLKTPLRLSPEGKAFLPDARNIILMMHTHRRADMPPALGKISDVTRKKTARNLIENEVTGESYYTID